MGPIVNFVIIYLDVSNVVFYYFLEHGRGCASSGMA
jgi:hypothetical protein